MDYRNKRLRRTLFSGICLFIFTTFLSCQNEIPTIKTLPPTGKPLSGFTASKTEPQTWRIKSDSCNQQWSLRINNSDDNTIASVNGAVVSEITYQGDSGVINLNSYLNNGSNTINFATYNNCYGCGSSPYTWGYNIYLNGEIYFNDTGSGFGPDGNILSHSNSVTISVCPNQGGGGPGNPSSSPGPSGLGDEFCGTLYDASGNAHENCLFCNEGEQIVFENGQPTRCKLRGQEEYQKEVNENGGFTVKYAPYGPEGMSRVALFDYCKK